jgi:hypothetical protein
MGFYAPENMLVIYCQVIGKKNKEVNNSKRPIIKFLFVGMELRLK